MARIGKIVTFNGSRQTISNELVRGITKLNLTSGINFSFVNDNTMHIYGDQAELVQLKNAAEARGFIFTLGGNAPAEPVSPPDDPTPSGMPLDNAKWRQATNKIREEDRLAILSRVNAEYDNLGGTREP